MARVPPAGREPGESKDLKGGLVLLCAKPFHSAGNFKELIPIHQKNSIQVRDACR